MITSIKCKDFEMEYCVFGNGPKNLIVIPGCSVVQVSPQEEALKPLFKDFVDDYRVWVFDRRSEVPKVFSNEQMAEDMADVMITLGLGKCDIYAASQGGMLTLCMALNHPELINKAVVTATGVRPNQYVFDTLGKWAELAHEKKRKELDDKIMHDMCTEEMLAQLPPSQYMCPENVTDAQLERFEICIRPMLTFDIYERLPEIKSEILVVGSRGDMIFSPEEADMIADKLGSKRYIYDETNPHSVYNWAPDFFPRMINYFRNGEFEV